MVAVRHKRGADESAGTREAILDATQAVLVEEGYPAVTSRRVAERAGLKSQLVHYYFATMDELFVAVYERTEKVFLERHLQAISSANPLRALWELSLHPLHTRLSREYIALSNHRESIRKITQRVLDQTHAINTAFIGKYLNEAGADPAEYPPIVVSHLINGMSRALINEEAMGVTKGHADVRAYADRMLARLEAMHKAARPVRA